MAESLVSQVRVVIGGLEYQIACAPAERQRLERLAAEFDRRVTALKERAGEIGDRRILVMAGLSLLDQLEAERERTGKLKSTVAKLERAREAAALQAEAEDDLLVKRIEEAAAAVDEAARLLNQDTRAILSARGLPTSGMGFADDPGFPDPAPEDYRSASASPDSQSQEGKAPDPPTLGDPGPAGGSLDTIPRPVRPSSGNQEPGDV